MASVSSIWHTLLVGGCVVISLSHILIKTLLPQAVFMEMVSSLIFISHVHFLDANSGNEKAMSRYLQMKMLKTNLHYLHLN